MKVKGLHSVASNSGLLQPTSGRVTVTDGNKMQFINTEFDWLEVKKGRYIQNGISHPLRAGDEKYYKRMYCLEHDGRVVYWLDTYGSHSSNHRPNNGHHVSFSWREHQTFLWQQNDHWLQKEENVRYIVNLVFLIIGVVIGIKQM